MMPLQNGWALGKSKDSVLYRSQTSVLAALENDQLNVKQWSRQKGSAIFTPYDAASLENSVKSGELSISYVLDSHLGGNGTEPFPHDGLLRIVHQELWR